MRALTGVLQTLEDHSILFLEARFLQDVLWGKQATRYMHLEGFVEEIITFPFYMAHPLKGNNVGCLQA